MPPIVNNILMWTFGKGREENLLTAGNCQARKVSHFKGRLLWVSFQSIAGFKLVSKPFLVAPKCTMNALNAGADVSLFTELTFSAVHLYNLAQGSSANLVRVPNPLPLPQVRRGTPHFPQGALFVGAKYNSDSAPLKYPSWAWSAFDVFLGVSLASLFLCAPCWFHSNRTKLLSWVQRVQLQTLHHSMTRPDCTKWRSEFASRMLRA